jgi:CMP-N-acetylneuraminic acid synthetase
MGLRALCVIPARGGSVRVPGKNLAQLGGRSLVRRALETALEAGCFDQVALSSDADAILAEADGLEVTPLRRPASLATAAARTLDVVRDVLERLDPDGRRFGAVAVVQCTAPFTAPCDLAGAMRLLESSGAASVVSVARLPTAEHPLKLKVLDGDRLLPYLAEDDLTPSHELPPLWVRNGSIYAARRDVVDAGKLVDDADVRGYAMPDERSFDIDTPRDLAFARFLLDERRDVD